MLRNGAGLRQARIVPGSGSSTGSAVSVSGRCGRYDTGELCPGRSCPVCQPAHVSPERHPRTQFGPTVPVSGRRSRLELLEFFELLQFFKLFELLECSGREWKRP